MLRPIQEPKTAQLAFRSDELHFTKLDDPAAADALADDPNADIIKLPSINYVWIGLNVEKKPLDDIRVRQAIRKAIDVDQVILAGYNGTVTRANALLAPGLLGYWADAPVYQRDVEGAKALLAEAGLASGLELKLTTPQPVAIRHGGAGRAGESRRGRHHTQPRRARRRLVLVAGRRGGGREPRAVAAAVRRQGRSLLPDAMVRLRARSANGTGSAGRMPTSTSSTPKRNRPPTRRSAAELYVQLQKLMDESAAYVWLTHEVNIFASKKWLQPSVLPNGDDWQYFDFKEKA